MQPTAFRYTFPIAKAEQRTDGFFLVGEASGPEIDATDERMAPEAITRFAAQIEQMAHAGNPLQYRDAHALDGVMRDLGVLTRAWIDERFHLGVEVKLDEDSPAAMYLFRQVLKGKQFGMSVAGAVMDYEDEFVAEVGRHIRTYKDVLLNEISNTTRPAWTPSLGTVLSKAIDEAAAESVARSGETVSDKNTLVTGEAEAAPADETAKAEDAAPEGEVEKAEENTEEVAETAKSEEAEAEVEKTDAEDAPALDAEEADAATEKSADESADEADATETTEKSADEEDADVEKAGRAISATNGKRLLALYAEMTETLTSLGLISDAPAKSDSAADETDLAKSLTVEKAVLEARVQELEQALTEKTARIEELENTPASTPPALIQRNEVDEAIEVLAKASPSDRLAAGLAARHG